jgi:hypothetical protein
VEGRGEEVRERGGEGTNGPNLTLQFGFVVSHP